MVTLRDSLLKIPHRQWEEMDRNSELVSSRLINRTWWNNKYYSRNYENEDGSEGCVEHIDEEGHREVPYERELFWPTDGRFGLGDKPVAYFSNDFGVNCCETIEQYRRREMAWEDLKVYLSGRIDPTPGLIGYPICVKLSPKIKIFDLTDVSLPFFESLASLSGWSSRESFLEEVIHSRDKSVYPLTQEISMAIYRRGFDGIAYTSVRAPFDVNMPSRNIVVFSRNVVLRGHC